jgi:beta-lactamase class A
MKTGTFLLSVLGSLLWLAAEARSQPSQTREASLNCLKAARTVLENCLAEIGDTAVNSRQTAAQHATGCQANFVNVTKNCQSEVSLNCKPAPENPECDRLSHLMETGSGPFGVFLKEVGQPATCSVNADTPYEPASAIKIIFGVYAVQQVQNGKAQLGEIVPVYDPNLTHPLISNDLEKAAERRALGYGFSEAGHQWS